MKSQPETLTILVPFKNREENEKIFIPYMKNYMKNYFEEINYKIVIIEQLNDKLFNKGVLFNIGFLLTSGTTDYYSLHDIDQLPISSDYRYKTIPMHMCINSIEQSNTCDLLNTYKELNYEQRGMIIINKEDYIIANGHSNNYWGWGLIDDDFSLRLIYSGIGLHRISDFKNKCYYISLKANTKRYSDDKNYKNNYAYAKKW